MIGSDNYKLTAEQLDFATAARRFSEQACAIAKAILVDGTAPTKVAKDFGVTRGRVYQIRDQVYAAFLEASSYPSDWQRVTLIASPGLIAQFVEAANQEHQAWLNSRSGAAGKVGAEPPAAKSRAAAKKPAATKKPAGAARSKSK